MSEMTRAHLEAVRECVKNDRDWSKAVAQNSVRQALAARAARLAEVAAMIEAKLEEKP